MEEINTLAMLYKLLPIIVIGIFIVVLTTCCIIGAINTKEKEKINLLCEINTRLIGIQQTIYNKKNGK